VYAFRYILFGSLQRFVTVVFSALHYLLYLLTSPTSADTAVLCFHWLIHVYFLLSLRCSVKRYSGQFQAVVLNVLHTSL